MNPSLKLSLYAVILLTSPNLGAAQIVPDELQQPPKLAAVGVFAAPYDYKDQSHFVRAVEDRFRFFEHALTNWSDTPNDKEEVVNYSKKAKEAIVVFKWFRKYQLRLPLSRR